MTRLLPDPPLVVPTAPFGLDPAVFELPERPEGLGLVPKAFGELRSLDYWCRRLPYERLDEGLEVAWEAYNWWRASPWYKVIPLIPQVPCSPSFRPVDLVGLQPTSRPDLAALVHDIHIGFAPPHWKELATDSQFLGRVSQITRAQSDALREAQRAVGAPEQKSYHQAANNLERSRRGVADLHGVFHRARPAHVPWASTLPRDVLISVRAPMRVPGKRGILFLDAHGDIRYWT